MKRVYLPFVSLLFFFACKKSVNTSIDLTAFLQAASTDSTEIVGSWTLIATRHYNLSANVNTGWRTQDTTQQKVVVDFGADSTFTYNNNYAWPAENYNRYYLDTALYAGHPVFRIYSTLVPIANVAEPHVVARLQNYKAMIITYMGIDAGDEELYAHNGFR